MFKNKINKFQIACISNDQDRILKKYCFVGMFFMSIKWMMICVCKFFRRCIQIISRKIPFETKIQKYNKNVRVHIDRTYW